MRPVADAILDRFSQEDATVALARTMSDAVSDTVSAIAIAALKRR